MLWPWPPVTVRARPAARIRGPGIETGGHGPRHVDARAAHPAEVANRGHAGVEVPLGVDHRLQRREAGRREIPGLLLEVGDAVELEVDVDVDQSRHQGLPCAVDLSSAARASFGALECAPTHSIPSVPKRTPWRFLTVARRRR